MWNRWESDALAVTVLGRAVPQGSLSHGVRGRAYWPARVRAWRELVATEALRAMRTSGLPLFDGHVAVGLRFYMLPTKAGARPGTIRADLDKLVRGVLDAFTGVVWPDDVVVCSLLASKRPVEAGSVERVEATVYLPSVTKA